MAGSPPLHDAAPKSLVPYHDHQHLRRVLHVQLAM